MRRQNSFISKMIMYMTIFIVLLMVLLVIVWGNSRTVMKNNTIDATKRTVSIYISDMENMMENTDRTMRGLMNNIGDILMLGSPDEAKRYFTAINLKTLLKNAQINNMDLDMLIVYNGKYDMQLDSESSRISFKNKIAIEKYIKEISSDDQQEVNAWKAEKIDNENYILRIYEIEKRVLCVIIKMDTLTKKMNKIEAGGHLSFAISDDTGNVIGAMGTTTFLQEASLQGVTAGVLNDKVHKGILVTQNFSNSNFKLSCFIPSVNVYGKFQLIQLCILLLILVGIGFILVFANYVRNELFTPIKQLLSAMNVIEKGDYHHRILGYVKNREFQKVNQSFNAMMEEILKLKIETYEEQLQLQEAEIRYVQTQIKPHFFLNAMTTIHSLSYQNRNEDIRSYIEALSKNVRYIFKASLKKVPLADEIVHLEDYFEMQEMLFPNCVMHYMNIEPEAKDCLFPPLILHTFIENEYKHAVSVDRILSIFISAQIVPKNDVEMLYISIEDDGIGFPDNVLKHLATTQDQFETDGHRIGLWNIKRTLSLLYKGDDFITFQNNENNGVKIEICIPIEKENGDQS